MKKLCLLLVLVLAMTVVTLSMAEESPFPVATGETVELPAFLQLTEIKNAAVWSYAPSEMGVGSLTSVIIVAPDGVYASEEEAKAYLEQLGLIDLAEKEGLGVILMNRSGDTWGEADLASYEAIINDVVGTSDGNEHTSLGYTTYLSQMYMVGEGSGATFINEYMTQHCDVLAAVATVGGEMPEVSNYAPLPAYIVNGTDAAVDFYKQINTVTASSEENGKVTWVDEDYTTLKVITAASDSDVLTAGIINDAYTTLFRWINRSALSTPVWYGGYEGAIAEGPLTLMDRPNYEALNLVFNGPCTDESIPNQTNWYEWIPSEALAEDNQELYPLVVVYHGAGDNPVFEAEQNGWVEMAGENRFMLLVPEDNNADGVALFGDPEENATQRNLDTLNLFLSKYPVDTSRIYLVGFSLGGINTIHTAESNLDLFAAIAPCFYPSYSAMSFGNPIDSVLNYEENGYDAATIDLPVFYISGTRDTSALPAFEDGTRHFSADTARLFNNIFKLDEIDAYIDYENLDFEKYPWFGFETTYNESLCFTNKHGQKLDTISYYNEDGVEMLRYMILEGGEHNHYTEIARYAWEYISQFSRNTETKEIVVAK